MVTHFKMCLKLVQTGDECSDRQRDPRCALEQARSHTWSCAGGTTMMTTMTTMMAITVTILH